MREEIVYCNVDESEAFLQIELAGTSYCDGSYSVRRDHSTVHVLEYVESGTGTVLLGDDSSSVRTLHPGPGCAYYLKSGEVHRYYSSAGDPWVKHFINVRGRLADSLLNAYGLESGVFPECRAASCFQEIFSLLGAEGNAGPRAPLLAVAFHELVAAVAASRTHTEFSDAEKIKLYLDENLRRPVTLGELSKIIFKSPSQVIRIFRTQYGVSPYHYLTQRRLGTAALLLRETGMSIRQIALDLQFADEHYFSGVFRQYAGLPPGRFRAAAEHGKNGCRTPDKGREIGIS